MKARFFGAFVLILAGTGSLSAESRWDIGAESVSSSDVDLWQFNTNSRWEMPERGFPVI